MLNPVRALSRNADSGRLLPHVDGLEPLYKWGVAPRHGQVIMIAGRSGSQKSGFALWWVDEMDLPALYFSADMSAFTASARLASKRSGMTTDQVERAMKAGGEARDQCLAHLADSKITFSFGSPITYRQIDEELKAYSELWNAWPSVIIYDNLMDFEGAQSEYSAQMDVMQAVTEIARDTSATSLIMHHASDKSWDARTDPWSPPSRDQVKGGLSEKPELSLSVALNPNSLDFNIACIKQRMGPQDPTAKRWVTLRCEPELTRFHKPGFRAEGNAA